MPKRSLNMSKRIILIASLILISLFFSLGFLAHKGYWSDGEVIMTMKVSSVQRRLSEFPTGPLAGVTKSGDSIQVNSWSQDGGRGGPMQFRLHIYGRHRTFFDFNELRVKHGLISTNTEVTHKVKSLLGMVLHKECELYEGAPSWN